MLSFAAQGGGGGGGGPPPETRTMGTFTRIAEVIADAAAALPLAFGCIVPISSPWVNSESANVLMNRFVINMCGAGLGNPMQYPCVSNAAEIPVTKCQVGPPGFAVVASVADRASCEFKGPTTDDAAASAFEESRASKPDRGMLGVVGGNHAPQRCAGPGYGVVLGSGYSVRNT